MGMDSDSGKAMNGQGLVFTVLATVIAASIIGLTVTLSGLREDMAVMKNDMQYLKQQASQSEISRMKMSEEINDLRIDNQRLKQDHTGVRQ